MRESGDVSMSIDDEIADMVNGLDENTNRLVVEGSKQIKRDMYKRFYAKTVGRLYQKSKPVGRKVAEKMCELKEDDLEIYSGIVEFWTLRNSYAAVEGAEKLPDWLSLVAGEKAKLDYAGLVKSVDWAVLSLKVAEDLTKLTEKERAAYAKLAREIGAAHRYSLDRNEALFATDKVFGLIAGGKPKEAEDYVTSLSGQKAEIEENKVR